MESGIKELEENVLPDLRDLRSCIKEATVADILARAIQMERDSMTFYSSLMSEVDSNYKELLEEFVKEENQHIGWLQQQSENL